VPVSLIEIATRFADGTNPTTKLAAEGLYELYDSYLRDLAGHPVTLLEVGVHSGESLKTFASYFANGQIIGVDIDDLGSDFSDHPNVQFEICDQRSTIQLSEVCKRHAPNGIDIIIDDASHYGAWSLMTYNALFPFLKPGGLYFVEDWATGYWGDWPDGGVFGEVFKPDGTMQKRVYSHDYGMVGFVKYLVDEVMSSGIRPSINAPLTRANRLDLMHVHKGMVVLRKAPKPD
jgi:hypothetical protein